MQTKFVAWRMNRLLIFCYRTCATCAMAEVAVNAGNLHIVLVMCLNGWQRRLMIVSPAEHAIENAVSALEHDTSYESWKATDLNLEYLRATPEEIWSMAQWVLHTKCQCCDKQDESHGHWVDTIVRGVPSICCSECGAESPTICPSRRCPNCGCIMMNGMWLHMAEYEMETNNTNSAWLRNQNEYALLTDMQRRLQAMIPDCCVLTVVSGKYVEPCIHDCSVCIQKWLYQKHWSELV